MILKLLRFLRGWVRFSVCGKYPERFINIALRRRISLWGVDRCDGGLSACMYMRDYLRVRECARASGVRLRVKERRGVPVFLRRYSDRAGLVFGAAAFVLTVFIMSLFIWSIDVTGLETISETGMRAMLRENGVYVGAFKYGKDFQNVTRSIMLDDGRIGWMAVNVTGSYASVEVKEKSPSPEMVDVGTPCDIKARRDGRILRINAEQGRTVLKEGSGVVDGQLIVSGVMEDALGGKRAVHSKAQVIAETSYSASFGIPRTVTEYLPTGETKRRLTADLFGLKIPLTVGGVSSPQAMFDEFESAPVPLGVRLPAGLLTRDIFAFEKQEISLDKNSAKELLLRDAALYETFALSGCTVTGRVYRLTETADGFTLSADYACTEDIAAAVPFDPEKTAEEQTEKMAEEQTE